jgi:ribosome-associated toxin RatA of RatAB toxin-antitoxin module
MLGDTCTMRETVRSALVARAPEVLYDLVVDVERYPDFVPGVSAAAVLERSDNEQLARLTVQRGPLRTEFTTRNLLVRAQRVDMQLVEGPFEVLQGRWSFTPVASNGCRIEFRVRFQFSNPLKSALFEPLFEDTVAALVRAFVARAQDLPA